MRSGAPWANRPPATARRRFFSVWYLAAALDWLDEAGVPHMLLALCPFLLDLTLHSFPIRVRGVHPNWEIGKSVATTLQPTFLWNATCQCC
jgi:hypothetical protein